MNRIVKLSMLILLCGIIASCGNSIVIKNADGVEYTSYQEACTAGDFASAHRYIDRMREEGMWEVRDAEDYVFRQEALFLMSQGTEASQQRIIYLLKQHPSDSNCDMLIELAIEFDQEDFVKSLTRHYKNDISSKILRKIIEYLYLEKGDENLEFITTLTNRYKNSDVLIVAAMEKDNEELVVSLANQYSGRMGINIFKQIINYLKQKKNAETDAIFEKLALKTNESEMLDYAIELKKTALVSNIIEKDKSVIYGRIETLALLNNNKISDYIIAFSKPSVEVPQQPKLVKRIDGYARSEYNDYQEAVLSYNRAYLELIDIAIAAKNRYLAQKAKNLMKNNIHANEYYLQGQGGWHHDVTLDNTDILEAEKRIKNASF
jgi:hypothetical protein